MTPITRTITIGNHQVEILNKTAASIIIILAALLLGGGHAHGGEPIQTINQVQTIAPAALDNKISEEGFSGLVVAMASWCPPCREELPVLAELFHKYREKGIQIVAVSVDAEGPNVVQPLINELKIPFPVYWVGTPAIRHYQIRGVPTLMIYDNGRLVEKIPGSFPRKFLEKKIRALMTASG